jgi:phosphatidylglycerol:prolipoprotein diacylglycerol transferase
MFEALLLPYPSIDPILIEIGPVAIRWYSLAYIGGILLGWLYARWLDWNIRPAQLLTKEQWEDTIVWAVVGVILGGRLGYVLFYQPGYFLENPGDILKLWSGGMSFHGGALGVIFAFWLFARKHKLNYVSLMDMICCAVPIGLFFGRIANFINGELYGRATDAPWAMIFPTGGPVPRHPSQLYEAGLEGFILFFILFIVAKKGGLKLVGLCSGLFLAGYGISRFIVEFFREPDAHLGTILGPLSMGQLLSIPMILIGLFFALRSRTDRLS